VLFIEIQLFTEIQCLHLYDIGNPALEGHFFRKRFGMAGKSRNVTGPMSPVFRKFLVENDEVNYAEKKLRNIEPVGFMAGSLFHGCS
jgi:hypothetical protein